MDVSAVLIEQLEASGELRSFRMNAPRGKILTVAFADEYDAARSGPFHFLDDDHEQTFREAFAECKVRMVSPLRFIQKDDQFTFRTEWRGIPTRRGSLSYYVLSLPENAIPINVNFYDPHSNKEYSKHVTRDDVKKRFYLYLECRSSRGAFDFVLDVVFILDADGFTSAEYFDDKMSRYGTPPVRIYEMKLPPKEVPIVQNFFINNGNAQVLGTVSKSKITLNQNDINTILAKLAKELKASQLPNEREAKILEDLATIKSQLDKQSPSSTIIAEAAKSIRTIVEGAMGNALESPLVTAAQSLARMVGL